MKMANRLFMFLFVALIFKGLFGGIPVASASDWVVSQPPAKVPLYRQDFPINIKNSDGSVFRSFSMEIPKGWNIVKDGLGFMVTQPVDARNRIVPKIEFQCLPGDTYKIFYEKEKKNAEGTPLEELKFADFKVLRRYFSPYPGNKAFKTLAFSVFKNNFTLRISTYAEDEKQIAPMIPIIEWAVRSLQLSHEDTGPFKVSESSSASARDAAPNTPVHIGTGKQSNGGSVVEVRPSESSTSLSASPQKELPAAQPSSDIPQDLIGSGEAFQADGTPDTKVYVSVPLQNARLKSMTFRNTDGVFSVWDTIPGNGMWVLGVNMRQNSGGFVNLNNTDGSLRPVDVNGEALFELRLHDSGVIAGRQTNFQLELELADGQKIVKKVAVGELGNIPAISATGADLTGSAAKNIPGPDFKIVAASFRPPHSAINSVGPYEEIKPDAEPDSMLSVEFFAAGKTLVNVEVRNTDGVFSVWDTIPSNGMWGLGVFVRNHQGKGYFQQNNPDSSLKPYLVKNAPEEINLRMADAGSIRDKSTSFMVTFSFSDGTSLTYNVGKPLY